MTKEIVVTYHGHFWNPNGYYEDSVEVEPVSFASNWTEAVTELVSQHDNDEVMSIISVEEDCWDDDDELVSCEMWQAPTKCYT